MNLQVLTAWTYCRQPTLNKPSAISPSRFFQIFVAISLLEDLVESPLAHHF